jgi:hypothetical protein
MQGVMSNMGINMWADGWMPWLPGM